MVFMFIVYFAGFATAIYCLSPAPEKPFASESTSTRIAASFDSEQFARSFNSGMHKALGIEPRAGLAEVLLDHASLEEAVVKIEGLNLDVLAVRGQPANPSELLASTQMRSLIEEVSRRYDRTILDTPATLGIPDSKAVTELCDGMLMVVRADNTPREDVLAALDVLDRRRLLGMVLNGADTESGRYRYY
jgi:Mrp family chromosome partitioning ATPase